MTEEEVRSGNILIADFLNWKVARADDYGITYHVPNRFQEDTGTTEREIESFEFDNDWNWLMFAWNECHRKVLIPILKGNPHLRHELNTLITDMRSSLKWAHIEGAYKVLVSIIKWYNSQLKDEATTIIS
jgi:hypothetical protein